MTARPVSVRPEGVTMLHNRWHAWGDDDELVAEQRWLDSVGVDIFANIVLWVEDRRFCYPGEKLQWHVGYVPSRNVADVHFDCEMNATGCYEGHECSALATKIAATDIPPPSHILTGLEQNAV